MADALAIFVDVDNIFVRNSRDSPFYILTANYGAGGLSCFTTVRCPYYSHIEHSSIVTGLLPAGAVTGLVLVDLATQIYWCKS